MDENALRRAVCETGRLLWERGLIAGSDGNLSARLADGAVLLTPSGASKGGLTPEALVVLDADGAPLRGAGKPSSEWRMHLAIYRARPEVGAVVHAHPPCATAFAAAGRVLPLLLPEAVLTLRRIGVAPYALPSSQALADGAAFAWLQLFARLVREQNFEAARYLFHPHCRSFGTLAVETTDRDQLVDQQWIPTWTTTRGFSVDPGSVHVESGGDLRILTARWSSLGASDGTDFARHGRCTFVLREVGETLRAVHSHFSLDPN